MMIDKLNYLVFKEMPPNEPGGVLKAMQLTSKFTSFKELGKQSGFLFMSLHGILARSTLLQVLPICSDQNMKVNHKCKILSPDLESIYYDQPAKAFVFFI